MSLTSFAIGTRRQRRAAFTLVELLVVLAIIGLLAGVISPQVMKHLGHAKTQTARMDIKNIGTALDMYRIDVGSYPTQEQGLQALGQQPTGVTAWKGPYIDKTASFKDPWAQPYIYRIPGQHGEYDLWSYGADKVEGGTGDDEDITNW